MNNTTLPIDYGTDYKRELHLLQQALKIGNVGKVRVCARRVVGFAIMHRFDKLYGKDALSILKTLTADDFPIELRENAELLLKGERDLLQGNAVAINPLEIAQKIITLLERYHSNSKQ